MKILTIAKSLTINNLISIYIVNMFINLFIVIIFKEQLRPESNNSIEHFINNQGLWRFLLFLPFAALWEEIFFRYVPIILGVKLNTLIFSIIVSSIAFGWLHGCWINIFIQGIMGLWLSLIYLKYYNVDKPYSVFPLFCSTLVHYVYNFLLAVMYLNS